MQQRSADSVGAYLQEIGRIPMLTPAEELHLGTIVQEWLNHPDGPDAAPRSLQRRGRRAKDRMVTANLRLVVNVAKKYRTQGQQRGLDLIELIQEGTIGLVRGVEKFDPSKGYKMSTYCYWWIRQSVTRALNTGGLIRLPIHISDNVNKLRRVSAQLSQQGITATPEALAEASGLTLAQTEHALASSQRRAICSLDLVINEDGGTVTLADLQAAPEDDVLARNEMWDAAESLRSWLPDDEALLSLYAVEGVSSREIGELLSVSGPTARVRIAAARDRLRAVAGDEVRELLAV